jgi:transcriptional regulator with XRE-family HTH domain
MVPEVLLTPEIRQRLRQLRLRAMLSLNEMADRLGTSRIQIWRLEQGRSGNPSLGTISRYLRASGARWTEIGELLDRVPIPDIDLKPVQESGLSDWGKAKASRAAQAEVERYAKRLPFRRRIKPADTRKQSQMIARLRNYRLVTNIVEEAVLDALRDELNSGVEEHDCRKVARNILGALWRAMGNPRQQGELVKAARGGFRVPPAPVVARLAAKSRTWRRMRFSPARLARIQRVVLERFRWLLDEHPELLPGSGRGK